MTCGHPTEKFFEPEHVMKGETYVFYAFKLCASRLPSYLVGILIKGTPPPVNYFHNHLNLQLGHLIS